jgi:hypothetical protein
MQPTPAPSEHVEPCARCGLPAERPTVAVGHVAGQDRDHLPLCIDCLPLLLDDWTTQRTLFLTGSSEGDNVGHQTQPRRGAMLRCVFLVSLAACALGFVLPAGRAEDKPPAPR